MSSEVSAVLSSGHVVVLLHAALEELGLAEYDLVAPELFVVKDEDHVGRCVGRRVELCEVIISRELVREHNATDCLDWRYLAG